jgi:hypothetical protein
MRRNPCRRKKRQKKSIFIYGTTFKKNESGRDFQQGQIWNDRSQKQNRTTAGTQYYCLLYDIYGNHTFCCKRGSKKRAHNVIATDSAGALLSPVLAQAGYVFPNTPMAVKQLFHLLSDSTAQLFDISFSPDPTSCHYYPYTTIGADISITGPPPTPKTYQPDAEDILKTITANADNNLQRHERGKLGRMHKPSTPTTPLIHSDEVISKLYQKNMVLFPFTMIDTWAQFGPMLQAFLTTTHHPRQKTWRTTHNNYKYHRPNANLSMYERASQPPCPLGILTCTPTLHPHQVYILSNSSDSAYLRHTAHYNVMLPARSNFIPQPLHLTPVST